MIGDKRSGAESISGAPGRPPHQLWEHHRGVWPVGHYTGPVHPVSQTVWCKLSALIQSLGLWFWIMHMFIKVPCFADKFSKILEFIWSTCMFWQLLETNRNISYWLLFFSLLRRPWDFHLKSSTSGISLLMHLYVQER